MTILGLHLQTSKTDADHMRTRYVHEDYLEWSRPEDRVIAALIYVFQFFHHVLYVLKLSFSKTL